MICQWKKVKIQTKWRKIKNKKTKSESGLYGKVIIAMKSNTDASAVTLFSIVTDLCDSAKVESFATNTERKKKKKPNPKQSHFFLLFLYLLWAVFVLYWIEWRNQTKLVHFLHSHYPIFSVQSLSTSFCMIDVIASCFLLLVPE